MTIRAAIDEFLNQKTLAVVGVSRSEKKFSNRIYKDLKDKGYKVFAVNSNTNSIGGEPCFTNIDSLPEKVGGVVIVVAPDETEKVVRDAEAAGINHIWIQQGAESQAAINFCKSKNIKVIHHQCILMFAEPTNFPHNVHHCIWRVLGKLPQ